MMSKYVKMLIVAAAVFLALGGVLAFLLLTKPSVDASVVSGEESSSGVNAYVLDKQAETVLSVKVENSEGSFTFTRQTRTVEASGDSSSTEEYYWTSEELLGVPQSDSTVKNFISNLTSLPQKSLVEENAEDLKKYGLDKPTSTALLKFEDGSEIKMQFGIKNPADESSVYYRADDEKTVQLVNYYAIAATQSDVRQFAQLTLTETRGTDETNDLEYLKITREDLETPVEIRQIQREEPQTSGEDEVTTFNTHRFVSPVTAEVDVTKGSEIVNGVYGLTVSGCEFLQQTVSNMEKCGLDKPRTEVEFKYGNKEYHLLIGNEVREDSAVSGESVGFSTLKGYYAAIKGVPGIYLIALENAPWVTFKVEDIISERPLSPYIYSCESVEIKVPEGEFKFDIDGDDKTFSYDGKQLDGDKFRDFYETLIGAVGEEFYSVEADGELAVSVTFNYKNGDGSDTLSYYESDDRKCVVSLNGKTVFKVRAVYAERLQENVKSLINGGEIKSDW